MEVVELYESTGPDTLFVSQTTRAAIGEASSILKISSTVTRQSIDGFGASFTDAAAYLIDEILNDEEKKQVMTNLFDPKVGIGLSVIRNPMGASDYARKFYSYDDQKVGSIDPDLLDFSIEYDQQSILPLTKWASELNPHLKVFASPWSPPAWMKTSDSLKGGKLKPEFYGAYANYFVKYLQAYQSEGVTINAVTPQNEPLFMPLHYPSMEFLAEEEARFIREYLKPAIQSAGLGTKIVAYDHNWDRIDYAYDVMDFAGEAIDGMAWHWYGGRPITQTRIQESFPNLETHFTEGSGGEWIPEFEPAFSNVMRTGIEIMRNYSRSFVLWNMALDEKNGPTVPGFGKSTCRGLLRINQQSKELTYTLDYYALAHFSKFVMHGAKCIETPQDSSLKNVAFLNEDDSVVIVAFNDSETPKTYTLELNNEVVTTLTITSKSAQTIVIK